MTILGRCEDSLYCGQIKASKPNLLATSLTFFDFYCFPFSLRGRRYVAPVLVLKTHRHGELLCLKHLMDEAALNFVFGRPINQRKNHFCRKTFPSLERRLAQHVVLLNTNICSHLKICSN